MDKYEELIKLFLPEDMFEYFEYKEVQVVGKTITVTLEEKSWVPKIPVEHRGKKVTSKGFKNFLVDDFPIRGKKVLLRIRRRVWKIEGVKKLLKRDIPITFPGTKLEEEFAYFLKGRD